MSDVRFLFDFISPNAYLAWMRIHDVAERCGRGVIPEPVLFAGLLNASGRSGPAEIPALWSWMTRNLLRKAALLEIPLAPPASHPFNPLLALRAATLPLADPERRALIDRLFRAAWAEGIDVSDAAEVARLASEIGLDGQAVVERAGAAATKARLRSRTEDAAAAGVFGVPTMIVGDELFWGHDDLEHLERHLQGRDPLRRAELPAWAAVRPSARRKG